MHLVILGVCKLVGLLFQRLGQSQVVSEMGQGVLIVVLMMGWRSAR